MAVLKFILVRLIVLGISYLYTYKALYEASYSTVRWTSNGTKPYFAIKYNAVLTLTVQAIY